MSNLSPLIIDDVESSEWDDAADVVVVGLGAAGITAAVEAREHGAQVLLVDRFEGGGATALSGGVFYAGGGTHIQEEAGVQGTVDDMYRYLSMEVQDAVSPEALRDFCETSAANVRWLTDRGVPFYGNLCPVKTSYPTNQYHLYFSGNEPFHPYADETTPVPRGHRTDGGAFPGANFIEPRSARGCASRSKRGQVDWSRTPREGSSGSKCIKSLRRRGGSSIVASTSSRLRSERCSRQLHLGCVPASNTSSGIIPSGSVSAALVV
jgi:hypothetical protein